MKTMIGMGKNLSGCPVYAKVGALADLSSLGAHLFCWFIHGSTLLFHVILYFKYRKHSKIIAFYFFITYLLLSFSHRT